MASSEPADEPAPVRNLRVTAVGEDALRLNWVRPTHYGGHKDILGYLVQVSAMTKTMTKDNDRAKSTQADEWVSQSSNPGRRQHHRRQRMTPPTTDADKTTYTYSGVLPGTDVLSAGSRRWFRVIAITLENDGLTYTGGDELPAGAYSARDRNIRLWPRTSAPRLKRMA